MKAKAFNKTDKGKQNVKNAQEKQFKSGYFKYGKGAISNMSKSAEHREIEFDLTEESLFKWWNSTADICHYCGVTVDQYRVIRDFIISYTGDNIEIIRFKKFFKLDIHAKINDMTIDRANNKLGYAVGNIVKSCWICNSLKSDFYSEDEMKVVSKLIMPSLIKIVEEQNEH